MAFMVGALRAVGGVFGAVGRLARARRSAQREVVKIAQLEAGVAGKQVAMASTINDEWAELAERIKAESEQAKRERRRARLALREARVAVRECRDDRRREGRRCRKLREQHAVTQAQVRELTRKVAELARKPTHATVASDEPVTDDLKVGRPVSE